jgi:hypothetical protein
MKSIYLASSLIVLGLILVLTSYLLPLFAPSAVEGTWTAEQAAEHAQVSADWHRLAHEQGHASETSANHQAEDAAARRAFDAAKAKYQEGDARLNQAQSLPDRIAFWIQCAGGALLVLGVAVYYSQQRKEA